MYLYIYIYLYISTYLYLYIYLPIFSYFVPFFLENNCRSYKLEQLKSGTYSVEAVKEHVTFNNLVSFKISPNTPTLPEITVKRLVVVLHYRQNFSLSFSLSFSFSFSHSPFLSHSSLSLSFCLVPSHSSWCLLLMFFVSSLS